MNIHFFLKSTACLLMTLLSLSSCESEVAPGSTEDNSAPNVRVEFRLPDFTQVFDAQGTTPIDYTEAEARTINSGTEFDVLITANDDKGLKTVSITYYRDFFEVDNVRAVVGTYRSSNVDSWFNRITFNLPDDPALLSGAFRITFRARPRVNVEMEDFPHFVIRAEDFGLNSRGATNITHVSPLFRLYTTIGT